MAVCSGMIVKEVNLKSAIVDAVSYNSSEEDLEALLRVYGGVLLLLPSRRKQFASVEHSKLLMQYGRGKSQSYHCRHLFATTWGHLRGKTW